MEYKPHKVNAIANMRIWGFLVPYSFLGLLFHMILENNLRKFFFLSAVFYFAGSNEV